MTKDSHMADEPKQPSKPQREIPFKEKKEIRNEPPAHKVTPSEPWEKPQRQQREPKKDS
jgi:hypothetical protein